MTIPEINDSLKSLTLVVDTREQDTEQFRNRVKRTELPSVRRKLEFGDYSCFVKDSDGREIDFCGDFAIERKMSLDELAQCFTRDRKRFVREFERAKERGAKLYLLVESASWEKAFAGQYRTRVSASALVASMTTWLARYDCQIVMCDPITTPKMLKEICFREAKKRLEDIAEKEESV